MSTPELSVILCTHHPRESFFPRVLAALAAQTLPREQWELLVVDNASKPPLDPVPDGRTIREETLGLVHARLAGIRESRGEILVFVDDDNLLAPDYLAETIEIGRAWPQLGTWGGQALAEWETTPPEWTRRFWNWIGVRELVRDLWSNVPDDTRTAPFGAGMCVRRRVAETWASELANDPIRCTLGRTGARLTGSEDSDLAFTACDLALGNGLFARLKLVHLIPQRRLEEDYLLELVESQTYSHTLLLHRRGIEPGTPSRAQRLLHRYQSFFIAARDRRFDDARTRGREAAIREIARCKNQNGHTP
jgi:glycosyltransferase involved in cell wall biosynthesis